MTCLTIKLEIGRNSRRASKAARPATEECPAFVCDSVTVCGFSGNFGRNRKRAKPSIEQLCVFVRASGHQAVDDGRTHRAKSERRGTENDYVKSNRGLVSRL